MRRKAAFPRLLQTSLQDIDEVDTEEPPQISLATSSTIPLGTARECRKLTIITTCPVLIASLVRPYTDKFVPTTFRKSQQKKFALFKCMGGEKNRSGLSGKKARDLEMQTFEEGEVKRLVRYGATSW